MTFYQVTRTERLQLTSFYKEKDCLPVVGTHLADFVLCIVWIKMAKHMAKDPKPSRSTTRCAAFKEDHWAFHEALKNHSEPGQEAIRMSH